MNLHSSLLSQISSLNKNKYILTFCVNKEEEEDKETKEQSDEQMFYKTQVFKTSKTGNAFVNP